MMFPAELLFAYILHSGKSGLHIFLGRYTIEQTDRQQKTIQLDRQTNRKSNRQIDEATFVCACVSIVTERQRNILLSKALFWYMYASVCEVAFRVLSVAITFCSNAQTAGPKDQESIDIRCNRHSSKPPPPLILKKKRKKNQKRKDRQKKTLMNQHSIRNSSQTPAHTLGSLLFSAGKGIMKIFPYCSPGLNSSLSLISGQPRSPPRPLSHAGALYIRRDIFIRSFPVFPPFPLFSPFLYSLVGCILSFTPRLEMKAKDSKTSNCIQKAYCWKFSVLDLGQKERLSCRAAAAFKHIYHSN